MKKCAYRNLGCKVNAFELEAMREQMEAAGYETVPFDDVADVYVIHTCTVTNIADRKSRQMVRQARRANENAIVVAAGCSVQSLAGSAKGFEDADILVGTNHKNNLAKAVAEYIEGVALGKVDERIIYVAEDVRKEKNYEEQHIKVSGEHSRANIKIEDGCDRFCSYCRIPFVRGTVRSRSFDSVVAEVTGLALTGVKEIVINGIDLSSYGKDLTEQKEDIADIILALDKISGIERIRLGSLEPGMITKEFLEKITKSQKLCPHFHLSMQSGSDTVLKRMNRHYTSDEYYEKCLMIRSYMPMAAITTDVIAGFPGETEDEFLETMSFVKKVGFSRIHAFPYSRREQTPAARMEGQLTEAVKKARCKKLIELGNELSFAYAEKFIGREAEILCEDPGEGYTREYVRACTDKKYEANTIVKGIVRAVDADGKLLL